MKKTRQTLDPKTLRAVAKDLTAQARVNTQVANDPNLTSAQLGEESLASAKALRMFARRYRNLASQMER